MSRPSRPITTLALALFAGVAALSACSGQNPYQAAESANSAVVTTPSAGSTVGDNDFLPEDQNVGTCIGAVDRPDCGSKSKGGWRMYLTFAVLLSGMAFIGWRIARSIKARDAVVNAGTEDGTPRRPVAATSVPSTSDEPAVSTDDPPVE
ncbi:MAG: hypothetical protein ABMA25_06810 [Ilumatobacteraceae bacterium]